VLIEAQKCTGAEGDWELADRGFNMLAEDIPQMLLYQVFRDRTADKKAPDAWNGVFRHDSK